MAFNPTQIQALQDPGIGAAASLLGSGIGSFANMLNNKRDNQNLLARQMLSDKASLTKAKLENAAELQKAKLLLPGQSAEKANQFMTLAKSLEDSGDFEKAERAREMANLYMSSAVGGGSNLSSGGGLSSSLAPSSMGSATTTPGMTNTIPSGGTNTATPGVVPPAEPANQDYNFGGSGTTPTVPSGVSFSGQKGISEATKAKADAARANVLGGVISSYDNALRAPDGATLSGKGGVQFQGIAVNPVVRAALEAGKQRYGINPAKADEDFKTNKEQAGTVLRTIEAIEKAEKFASSNIFQQMMSKGMQAGGQTGSKLPFSGLTLAKQVGLISPKDAKQFEVAKVAQKGLDAMITTFAKSFNDESGNLSNNDVTRAKGLIPDFNSDKGEFIAQKKEFVNAILPKVIEASLVTGDAVTYNKAQETYKRIIGKNYKVDKLDGQMFGDVTVPKTQSPTTSEPTIPTPAGNKPSYSNDEMLKMIDQLRKRK